MDCYSVAHQTLDPIALHQWQFSSVELQLALLWGSVTPASNYGLLTLGCTQHKLTRLPDNAQYFALCIAHLSSEGEGGATAITGIQQHL